MNEKSACSKEKTTHIHLYTYIHAGVTEAVGVVVIDHAQISETDNISTDHFARYAPEHIEYGVNRYRNETRRLYGVLDKHLSDKQYAYLTGEKCTIAGE